MSPEDVDTRLGHALKPKMELAVRRALDEPHRKSGASHELMRCPARWTISREFNGKRIMGPKHQTLRQRGVAPAYPRSCDLENATTGTFVMVDGGIVLEPERATQPCNHISAQSIARTIFYADAMAVFFDDHQRAVIAMDAVERADTLFQSRF